MKRNWITPVIVIGTVGAAALTIYLIQKNKKSSPFDYNPNLSSKQKIANWILWMTPHAKKIGRKFGLPWQALVAQTGWETGWGKSSLASKGFNFAGIKAVGNEPYILAKTHEYENGVKVYKNAKFRKFKSVEDGLEHYGNFFIRNPRYAKALNYPKDPYKFISEIRKAGYATDPNYISNLHGVLNKYF
jgi:flagellar protein FlgJ